MKTNFTISRLLITSLSLLAMVVGCKKDAAAPSPDAEEKFVIKGLQSIIAGECKSYELVIYSRLGSQRSSAAERSVNVLVGGNGSYLDEADNAHLINTDAQIYQDASCSQPVSQVSFLAGANSMQVYLKNTIVDTVMVVADDGQDGLKPAVFVVKILGPTKINVTAAPAQVIAGNCTSAFSFTTLDNGNVPYNVAAATQVNLASTEIGGFYSRSDCAGSPMTNFVMNPGEGRATFYYKSPNPKAQHNIDISFPNGKIRGTTNNLQVLKPALLTLDVNSLAFGDTEVGKSSERTVNVANTGEVGITGLTWTLPAGDFSYKAAPNSGAPTCGATLAAGANCNITIVFTPSLNVSRTNNLTVSGYFDGSQNKPASTVSLSGRGVYLPGTVDPGFNGNTFNAPAVNNKRKFVMQSDGKTVFFSNENINGNSSIVLTRFNVGGGVDTSFGNNGRSSFSQNGIDVFGEQIKMSGSKYVVVGKIEQDFLIVLFNSDGSFDRFRADNFGLLDPPTQTILDANDGALAVAVGVGGSSGNAIYVAGYSGTGVALAKYSPGSLSLDNSFGTSGHVLMQALGTDMVNDLIVTSDGKVFGLGETGGRVLALRILADGSPDTSFNAGNNGNNSGMIAINAPIGTGHFGTSAALLSTGKTLFTVRSRSTTAAVFTIGRINVNGSLDAGFDGDGFVQVNISNLDYANAISVQADGKILAAGKTGSNNARFAAVRLLSTGQIDTAFGSNGRAIFGAQGSSVEAFSIGLQTQSNRLLFGGSGQLGIQLQRLFRDQE